MAVGVAHDLALFVAELVEELTVGFEEAVNSLFSSMRIVFKAG